MESYVLNDVEYDFKPLEIFEEKLDKSLLISYLNLL